MGRCAAGPGGSEIHFREVGDLPRALSCGAGGTESAAFSAVSESKMVNAFETWKLCSMRPPAFTGQIRNSRDNP